MVTESAFGGVDGRPARSFVIEGDGIRIRLTDFGARLVELWVPDRNGRLDDIVLGFDRAEDYARWRHVYFGATVGRYGNRISHGRLPLQGREYQLDLNEGRNHLHGGRDGWDCHIWDAEATVDAVVFRTSSPDGDMGYPGACEVAARYELIGSTLRISMEALPSATTVVNMVHHSYFNLAGHASGDILGQELRMPSDFYVPVDTELLPTGEVRSVVDTAFDFRESRRIDAATPPSGFDHNWCLRNDGSALSESADAYDAASGRRMRLWSTEPGVQMYTGGYLDASVVGKGGSAYCRNAGFTLETQKFPDSPRFSHFPSSVVSADETYRHVMEFQFSVD